MAHQKLFKVDVARSALYSALNVFVNDPSSSTSAGYSLHGDSTRSSTLKTVPGIVPTGYQLSVVIYRGYRSYRAPSIGIYEVFEMGVHTWMTREDFSKS